MKPISEYKAPFEIEYDILKKLYDIENSGLLVSTSANTSTCNYSTDITSLLTALYEIKASIDSKEYIVIEKPVEVIKEVIKEVEVPVEVIKEVIKEVQVPVEVIKEVIIEKIIYECPPENTGNTDDTDTIPEPYITITVPDETNPCYPYRTFTELNPQYKAYLEKVRKEREEKNYPEKIKPHTTYFSVPKYKVNHRWNTNKANAYKRSRLSA